MKKNIINSYPLRFYNFNSPLTNIPNFSDISRNSYQKIITVEKNLNDLKLDTETEISKGGSDLSFVLDGLKKEIDEISQNIMETDKRVKGYEQRNLENSRKLREKSLNNIKFPSNKDFIQTEIHFYSPDRYFKYNTPSRTKIINNNYNQNKNLKNYNSYFNNNLRQTLNDNKYFSTYNFNINDIGMNSNNYYHKDINLNNYNSSPQRINTISKSNYIQKGYIKHSNASTNKNKSEKSLNTKVNEIKNELDPLKNITNKLIKDTNSLKAENQKLINENNEYKSQIKIINDSLNKTKKNYENELKAKEILLKEMGQEVQKLKDKIYNLKDIDNNNNSNRGDNLNESDYNNLLLKNNELIKKNKELNFKIKELLNNQFKEEEKKIKNQKNIRENVLKKGIHSYQEELESLQDEYDKIFNDNIKLNEENKKLINTLDEMENDKEEHNKALINLKNVIEENEKLKDKNLSLNKDNSLLIQKLKNENNMEKLAKNEENLKNLEKKLNELKNENEEKEKKLNILKEKYQKRKEKEEENVKKRIKEYKDNNQNEINNLKK